MTGYCPECDRQITFAWLEDTIVCTRRRGGGCGARFHPEHIRSPSK